MNRWFCALFGAVTAVILVGCGNMRRQENARPLDSSRFFKDGASARPTPPHTVARGEPDPDDPFVTGCRNGRLLKEIPLPITAALLERGQERFNIYCAVCHGRDGYGTGIVVRRGFPPPPSYHIERLRDADAGHFFDVMTQGYGAMPSYADRIDPHDRWAIVAYIRALQRSQHATLADVPVKERALLLSMP